MTVKGFNFILFAFMTIGAFVLTGQWYAPFVVMLAQSVATLMSLLALSAFIAVSTSPKATRATPHAELKAAVMSPRRYLPLFGVGMVSMFILARWLSGEPLSWFLVVVLIGGLLLRGLLFGWSLAQQSGDPDWETGDRR